MRTSMLKPMSHLVVVVLLGSVHASSVAADGEKNSGLTSWGKLGKAVKGADGFHELTYYKKDARGRLKATKGFVKIPEKVPLWMDQAIRLQQLEVEKDVYVLGKTIEHEVRGQGGGIGAGGGSGGKDRQIQNAQVIFTGEHLQVNQRYKDSRDKELRWLQGRITRISGGLWVNHKQTAYRVVMNKSGKILKRMKGERKYLRSGVYVFVRGRQADERPATNKKSDATKPAFEADEVVLLDRRLIRTVYSKIFE